ncbi:YjiH family protein [bacterium]|nr:YjiH family protein [bacterium]
MYNLSAKRVMRFVIPSLIGVFLFLAPISHNGEMTICISVILDLIRNGLGFDLLTKAAVLFIVLGGILVFIGSFFKPKLFLENEVLKATFVTEWYWALIRFIGGVIVVPVFVSKGPEWLVGPDTGGFVLFDLVAGILPIAFVATAAIPLLLNFGLMEFVGTFCSKFFKALFKIPGRAAIDCLTSFVGDTAIGVIMTNNQYKEGYYNGREAAVILTTFTSVSITFMLVIIQQVGLPDMFFPYLLALFLTYIICAMIIPRIPPLSLKKDEYYNGVCNYDGKLHPDDCSLAKWAIVQATEKANNNGLTPKKYALEWAKNCCMILFTLNNLVMAIATFTLVLAYFTPIFTWLGVPFVPVLNLLHIPEAETVSTTLLAGFADMFIPASIAGAQITSTFSKMLVAVLSVCQLIFMSETGSMILSTEAPVKFIDLVFIFLERTVLILIIATVIIRFVLGIPMI